MHARHDRATEHRMKADIDTTVFMAFLVVGMALHVAGWMKLFRFITSML